MYARHPGTTTSLRRRIAGLATAAVLLAAPAAPAAFLPLPASGSQVNDDRVNTIDPDLDAGVSDVVGGAVTAGKTPVPWAAFEQKAAGGEQQHVVVRAFRNGAWVTQGSPASLDIDPAEEAEAPSIDFAGPGRTVPWVAWYEPNAASSWPTNIFASRFNVAANRWLPSGQGRGPNHLPSLNVNPRRTAEHPSVAGGATVAGNDPVPWVAWEENGGVPNDGTTRRQIFVAKAVKQAVPGTPCPDGTKPAGGVDVNGFCWQQVGLDRLNPTGPLPLDSGEPTLNVDPTRSGVEPDIAFTGPNDTVAWVVWYEEDATGIDGLRGNDMVFAAKIVADATADGGFHWVAVGNGTAGRTNVLDTSGAHGFGDCAESQEAEEACTLNAIVRRNAENPRVAAGTLTPGGTTVPWVVWQEELADGLHGVFVSRLVGGDHFELVNGGLPVSNAANDATRPDITFSGNTPYVSWQELIRKAQVTFVGHFEAGAFRLDTPTGIPGSEFGTVEAPLRAPISSGCTANPFSGDGASCQGGAVGTPFFLFTAGDPGGRHLLARAFAPTDVATLAATDVSTTGATLNGSANPAGAAILAHFDFGPTTAYGAVTPDAVLDTVSAPRSFAARVDDLTPGATIHFRAAARTDFVTIDGPDQRFVVENVAPTVSVDDLPGTVRRRDLGPGRLLSLHLSVSEPATITLAILNKKGKVLRQVTFDQTSPGSFAAPISLKRLKGKLSLRVTATDPDGATAVVQPQFRAR